jgi:hypothetical protein
MPSGAGPCPVSGLNGPRDRWQNELSVQRPLRVDVQTALTTVIPARGRYQASVKARILQEQTADAEMKKLDAGASTPHDVILMQDDVTGK